MIDLLSVNIARKGAAAAIQTTAKISPWIILKSVPSDAALSAVFCFCAPRKYAIIALIPIAKPVTIWSEIFSYIKILAAAVIIAFVFTQYIIVNAEVPTGSMKNTIMEHDRLIGFRLAYLFDEPERGDVVIFKYPDNEEQNYVKRIIGTPGDVVQIKSGHVYVNGEELSEDYLKEPMAESETEETYVVPEGHYFMMGDNRNSSLDSRYWKNTYVAKDKILAKVIFRYYDGFNGKIDFSLIH